MTKSVGEQKVTSRPSVTFAGVSEEHPPSTKVKTKQDNGLPISKSRSRSTKRVAQRKPRFWPTEQVRVSRDNTKLEESLKKLEGEWKFSSEEKQDALQAGHDAVAVAAQKTSGMTTKERNILGRTTIIGFLENILDKRLEQRNASSTAAAGGGAVGGPDNVVQQQFSIGPYDGHPEKLKEWTKLVFALPNGSAILLEARAAYEKELANAKENQNGGGQNKRKGESAKKSASTAQLTVLKKYLENDQSTKRVKSSASMFTSNPMHRVTLPNNVPTADLLDLSVHTEPTAISLVSDDEDSSTTTNTTSWMRNIGSISNHTTKLWKKIRTSKEAKVAGELAYSAATDQYPTQTKYCEAAQKAAIASYRASEQTDGHDAATAATAAATAGADAAQAAAAGAASAGAGAAQAAAAGAGAATAGADAAQAAAAGAASAGAGAGARVYSIGNPFAAAAAAAADDAAADDATAQAAVLTTDAGAAGAALNPRKEAQLEVAILKRDRQLEWSTEATKAAENAYEKNFKENKNAALAKAAALKAGSFVNAGNPSKIENAVKSAWFTKIVEAEHGKNSGKSRLLIGRYNNETFPLPEKAMKEFNRLKLLAESVDIGSDASSTLRWSLNHVVNNTPEFSQLRVQTLSGMIDVTLGFYVTHSKLQAVWDDKAAIQELAALEEVDAGLIDKYFGEGGQAKFLKESKGNDGDTVLAAVQKGAPLPNKPKSIALLKKIMLANCKKQEVTVKKEAATSKVEAEKQITLEIQKQVKEEAESALSHVPTAFSELKEEAKSAFSYVPTAFSELKDQELEKLTGGVGSKSNTPLLNRVKVAFNHNKNGQETEITRTNLDVFYTDYITPNLNTNQTKTIKDFIENELLVENNGALRFNDKFAHLQGAHNEKDFSDALFEICTDYFIDSDTGKPKGAFKELCKLDSIVRDDLNPREQTRQENSDIVSIKEQKAALLEQINNHTDRLFSTSRFPINLHSRSANILDRVLGQKQDQSNWKPTVEGAKEFAHNKKWTEHVVAASMTAQRTVGNTLATGIEKVISLSFKASLSIALFVIAIPVGCIGFPVAAAAGESIDDLRQSFTNGFKNIGTFSNAFGAAIGTVVGGAAGLVSRLAAITVFGIAKAIAAGAVEGGIAFINADRMTKAKIIGVVIVATALGVGCGIPAVGAALGKLLPTGSGKAVGAFFAQFIPKTVEGAIGSCVVFFIAYKLAKIGRRKCQHKPDVMDEFNNRRLIAAAAAQAAAAAAAGGGGGGGALTEEALAAHTAATAAEHEASTLTPEQLDLVAALKRNCDNPARAIEAIRSFLGSDEADFDPLDTNGRSFGVGVELSTEAMQDITEAMQDMLTQEMAKIKAGAQGDSPENARKAGTYRKLQPVMEAIGLDCDPLDEYEDFISCSLWDGDATSDGGGVGGGDGVGGGVGGAAELVEENAQNVRI